MKILSLIAVIILALTVKSWSAYVITCANGITAINQTGQYTYQNMVNGVMVDMVHVFTSSDYDSQINAQNCVDNYVPDNQVFSGNALTN